MSDGPLSGAISAFVYGLISIGALFGPALGARLWRYHKALAAFIWAVALAALAIAITNEVGALAGRGSEQTARRTSVADAVGDAWGSLELALAERKSLKFAPADVAAVEAAKAKASAATFAKNAECTIRGSKCQAKETVEGQALADLAAVTRDKALTDQAAKLDTNIAALREKIARAGPVRETNTQGKALARLFGLDDAEAAQLITRQNTAMMIVVELPIVVFILAAEEIGRHEPAPSPERLNGRREDDGGQVRARSGQVDGHPCPSQQNQGFDAEIIPFKPKGAHPPAQEEAQGDAVSGQVRTLAAQGLSQVAIAKQLGIGRATVQRHLKKAASADA